MSEWYNKIINESIFYNYINIKVNSLIQYLYDSLLEYRENQSNKFDCLTFSIVERIILEYYSSLDKINITMLPNDSFNLDNKYFNFITELNNSTENYKVNQII